jgi:hypothetical protein
MQKRVEPLCRAEVANDPGKVNLVGRQINSVGVELGKDLGKSCPPGLAKVAHAVPDGLEDSVQRRN